MNKFLCGLLAYAASVISSPSYADGMDKQYDLDLVRSSIKTVLAEFSRQTGIQTGFWPEGANEEELILGPLKGNYTADEALRRLLSKSGLRFMAENDHTVTVIGSAIAESAATYRPSLDSGRTVYDQRKPAFVRLVDDQSRVHLATAELERISSAVPLEDVNDQSGFSRDSRESDSKSIDEVVVIGTHIHGIKNMTAPVSVYDRETIERTGRMTTQSFVETLPQNFKGGSIGVSADGLLSSNGRNNIEYATGVNLRGLGNSSTLILLNGHRLAPSAYGSAVDVSTIPLNAIERVEVLTDGASAVYGADAVGGVVNFVLRRTYDGEETNINAGSVTSGNYNQAVLGQTLGRSWEAGGGLLTVQYQKDAALSAEDRDVTSRVPLPTDIYPSSERYGALFSIHQNVTDKVTVSGDLLYNYNNNRRDFTSPGIGTESFDNKSKFTSAHAGITLDLYEDWRAEVGGLYGDSHTVQSEEYADPGIAALLFPGFVNGSDLLRNVSSVKELDLKLDGKLLSLPAGSARVALGGSYREESFSSYVYYKTQDRRSSRYVGSEFAELYVPLIGGHSSYPLVERLDLSAAVRHDSYSDFGETTNPKFGVFWAPIEQIGFRASYGTSFRAPSALEDLASNQNRTVFSSPGYAQPTGGTGAALVFLSAIPLVAEESRNLSLGIDFKPNAVPELSLSANYYRISYRNRLISAPGDRSILIKPQVYGTLITSFASDAEAAAYLAHLVAEGYQFINTSRVGTTGVRYAVPFGQINAASLHTSGFDLTAAYSFLAGRNTFDFRLGATNVVSMDTGFCSSCSTTDISNTFGQPLHWRGRGDIGWSRGEWRVNAAVNYAGHHKNTLTVPASTIDSFTTVDVSTQYKPSQLKGVTLGLSATNILDAEAPTALGAFNNVNFDVQNSSALGRFVAIQLRKTW